MDTGEKHPSEVVVPPIVIFRANQTLLDAIKGISPFLLIAIKEGLEVVETSS